MEEEKTLLIETKIAAIRSEEQSTKLCRGVWVWIIPTHNSPGAICLLWISKWQMNSRATVPLYTLNIFFVKIPTTKVQTIFKLKEGTGIASSREVIMTAFITQTGRRTIQMRRNLGVKRLDFIFFFLSRSWDPENDKCINKLDLCCTWLFEFYFFGYLLPFLSLDC